MFDSALYKIDAKWRSEPASSAQYSFLEDRGVSIDRKLTKGEASDLISSLLPPDDDQIEFLSAFGIDLADGATQCDATRAIMKIVSSPENKAIWERRPATPQQITIVQFVDGTVRPGLTFDEADALIDSYRSNEAKLRRFVEIREAVNDQETRLYLSTKASLQINEEYEGANFVPVSSGEVYKLIVELEHDLEMTVAELEDDDELIELVVGKLLAGRTGSPPSAGSGKVAARWLNEPSRSPRSKSGSISISSIVVVCVALAMLSKCVGG